MVGGNYTYAQVPLGFWMQDAFGFARNHYDRIGHFAQGFIPAMLAREIFLRALAAPGEPLAAVRGGVLLPRVQRLLRADRVLDRAGQRRSGGRDFLGTQGDVWDTQWDMQLALIGAITALVLLAGCTTGRSATWRRWGGGPDRSARAAGIAGDPAPHGSWPRS